MSSPGLCVGGEVEGGDVAVNKICKDPIRLLLPLLLEPSKGDRNQANNYETMNSLRLW